MITASRLVRASKSHGAAQVEEITDGGHLLPNLEPDLAYGGIALQHSLPGFAPLKVFVVDLNLFVYPCCGRARAASICILP
jgi:hypothetical protein